MAARAGVQQSVVSAYESGGREPSLATLSSLVEACGVSLEVHPRRGAADRGPPRRGRTGRTPACSAPGRGTSDCRSSRHD
ncbi:MAG: helix-turn-helix transcriptional regulator [Actinomycetota bacterium]|nr:helix-turn-helix transcriptional regulator [Actinomycetota bacterium]